VPDADAPLARPARWAKACRARPEGSGRTCAIPFAPEGPIFDIVKAAFLGIVEGLTE
jgi:hypothetical protein